EIGGETVGGAKRRLSEFDGRRREIGVLRKEGVDDLLRDNRRSIVPRRTRVGTPAFVDHNGHLSRTSRTVFDADRAGAVGETGVEDQDALIIDVESVRDLKKVVAELYRARILSGLNDSSIFLRPAGRGLRIHVGDGVADSISRRTSAAPVFRQQNPRPLRAD